MPDEKKAWENIHQSYSQQDWIKKPSIFAEEAIKFFPRKGKVLEIGGGLGQDAKFFAENGYQVTLTDRSADALAKAEKHPGIETAILDASQPFPFPDASFDVVYAHLSLHYFDAATTHKIFAEIKHVLVPGGIVAAFFNTDKDPEFGTGTKLEEGYFEIRDVKKRFFSTETLKPFVKGFETALLDDKGETYKDAAKGIHGLIRFIGKKG